MGVGSRTPVLAQNDEELSRNWDLHAGFFVPERAAPRAAEGDIWLALGADKPIYVVERWKITFSLDYYGSGNVYNVPIRMNVMGETNKLRYGMGAGVGISHDLVRGQSGFTWMGDVGYYLTRGEHPLMVDLRYNYQSTGSGTLNGWEVLLGYRF
jgi:hypothetical protein